MSTNQIDAAATDAAVDCLEYGRVKIEHCLAQLSNDQVWWRPRENMNSIGNLLLHLAGNMKQWIVSGIGDTPDTRERQAEFDHREMISKQDVYKSLCDVIAEASNVLKSASADDLISAKRIQGHDVTKMEAMWHSVTHFQGHVQEIICLTRWQLGNDYKFQWEPKTQDEGA